MEPKIETAFRLGVIAGRREAQQILEELLVGGRRWTDPEWLLLEFVGGLYNKPYPEIPLKAE